MTVSASATVTAAGAAGHAPAALLPCWLVVHEMQDSSAAALVRALQDTRAGRTVSVHAVSTIALMAGAHWTLQVDGSGSRCALRAPEHAWAACGNESNAGDTEAPSWFRLAAVVNRCGPVRLHNRVTDADYKSAEWSALLAAWLHGLPCQVVNRPWAPRLYAAAQSPARWRQAAALRGLPVWPWPPRAVELNALAAFGTIESAGLLVVHRQVFEVQGRHRPNWSAAAHRAAARAAADCGCPLLTWTGCPDAQGRWRITGANPWPDLRPFGPAAAEALATELAQPNGAPTSSPACMSD